MATNVGASAFIEILDVLKKVGNYGCSVHACVHVSHGICTYMEVYEHFAERVHVGSIGDVSNVFRSTAMHWQNIGTRLYYM